MHRILFFSIVITAIFAAMPLAASAESVLWNTTIQGGVGVCEVAAGTCPQIPWQVTAGFNDPDITVQYRAFVTNADTGETILSGASVPVGTRLTFTFDKHVYQDISWFAVGSWLDSPYGDWGNPSTAPSYTCASKDFVGQSTSAWASVQKVYAPLTAAEPNQSIMGLDGGALLCGAFDGSSVTCTAQQAGPVPAVFDFKSTQATFHSQWIYGPQGPKPNQCLGTDIPMLIRHGVSFPSNAQSWAYFAGSATYNFTDGKFYRGGQVVSGSTSVTIPEQQIRYTITITTPTGSPPTAPTLSSTSCTTGNATNITMTSTDPDNDNIRYGIDWDADGSVDQWVPATGLPAAPAAQAGFVPSGTSQSASRTYSTEGTKTVKVLAQDSNGNSSSWASVSFDCTSPTQQNINNNGSGSGGNSSFNAINNQNNTQGNLSPDLRLTVPSLVARNHTVQVTWTADNVASCLPVTGDNGDSFPQAHLNTSFFSPVGGVSSSPITTRTVYTLTCTDPNGNTLTKQATVSIQPNFRER